MAKSQVVEKRKPATQARVVETPVVETPAVDPEVPTCQHHWVIESPRGALSSGRCKVCGEIREFRNSTTDYVWDDDSGKGGYSPWRGVRNTPAKGAMSDDDMSASARTGQHMLTV
jgi:hypothetical protein